MGFGFVYGLDLILDFDNIRVRFGFVYHKDLFCNFAECLGVWIGIMSKCFMGCIMPMMNSMRTCFEFFTYKTPGTKSANSPNFRDLTCNFTKLSTQGPNLP